MKKLRSKLVVLALLSTLVGGAWAIIPAIVGTLIYFAADATFVNALGISTVAVGSAIAFIGFQNPDPAVPAKPDITVQLAPNAALETPAGWTAPVPGTSQPTPPSSLPAGNLYTTSISVCSGSGATRAAAAAALVAVINGNGGFCSSTCICQTSAEQGSLCQGAASVGSVSDGTNSGTLVCSNGNGGAGIGFTAAASCVAGYTVAGAVCNLTDASLAAKPMDGRATFVRVGNNFVADARDPDNAFADNIIITNNTIAVAGSDGRVQMISSDASTGRITVSDTVPGTGANVGTSTRTQVDVGSPNAAGTTATVTGKSAVTFQGSGTAATSPAVTGSGTCGGVGQTACGVKVDESGTPTNGTLTESRTAIETATALRETGITNAATGAKVTSLGLGLSINWPTVACQNPSLVMPGGHGVLSVDICSRSADIKAVSTFVFACAIAIYLFFIGAGAIKGG